MLAFPALAVGSLLVAALSPQGEAPVVVPLRVELADGTPMPGVPIVVPVPMPVEVAALGSWR